MEKIALTLLLIITLTCAANARVDTTIVDTVHIDTTDICIKHNSYNEAVWVYRNAGWNEVINSDTTIYYIFNQFVRVYDNDRLLFTVLKMRTGPISGTIAYYYKTGELKRMDYLTYNLQTDTCDESFSLYETDGLEYALHFRKDGSLAKRRDVFLKVSRCNPVKVKTKEKTTKYNKKQQVRSVRIHSFRDSLLSRLFHSKHQYPSG